MDSVTHLAVGVCLGEAFAGRSFGRKAMLWGAAAHSLPDVDFLAVFWLDTSSNLLAHRGFTHSLLFCVIMAAGLAALAYRLHRRANYRFAHWFIFMGVSLLVHVFLDGCNVYGVGWLEPFSHHRFSFNMIYVVDPFFSIFPSVAALFLLIRKFSPTWLVTIGLGCSGLYLIYCTANKIVIDATVERILKRQDISYQRYMTTPSPLQTWLWYVVVEDKHGFYVGFHSVFSATDRMHLSYFLRNDSLGVQIRDQIALARLRRFSKGFYTFDIQDQRLVFNDLRFGQVAGWQNDRGKFVFRFYLNHPEENTLAVQRGRMEGWDAQSVASFFEAIAGKSRKIK